jgi:DNA-binding transcriptional LysR family regulator
MPPDLRLFRYAVAVAEERGFGRAAQRLRIAQPPLSQQIRRLEGALGIVLFERGAGGAVPTPAGKVFVERARVALREAEGAVEAARRAVRGEIGTLTLGLAGGTMFSFLPVLLRDFRAAFPSIALDLRNLTPDEQMTLLASGGIDLGFTRRAPAQPGIALELAHAEPFMAALPARHLLTRRRSLVLADLAQEPFVLFPRAQGSGFHAEVAGLCLAANFAPHVVQEIAPMHAVIGLVGAGLGVSVVPASVRALKLAGVVFRPLRGLEGASQIFLAKRATVPSPAATSFIEFARARLRNER